MEFSQFFLFYLHLDEKQLFNSFTNKHGFVSISIDKYGFACTFANQIDVAF